MTEVVGIDPSLTATGIAADGPPLVVRAKGLRGCERLDAIREAVLSHVAGADLVVIEGYSFNSRNGHAHALGELGGLLRWTLWREGRRVLVVPPATLKKYATGKGGAPKEAVLVEAVHRLGYAGHDHNEADALWLREIGLALMDRGAVEVPKAHRAALDALEDPTNEGN